MNIEDLINTGAALLAVARNRLTGKEIEACEWVTADDFLDNYEIDGFSGPDEPEEDDFETTEEYDHAYQLWESTEDKWKTMKRLNVEFYATICNWIDSNNRDSSARAIETHNRLHPQAA